MHTDLHTINLLDLYNEGGWYIMWPLTLFLGIALFITIERYLVSRSAISGTSDFVQEMKRYLAAGDYKGLQAFSAQRKTAYARLVHTAAGQINHKDLPKVLEEAGRFEVYEMEKNLSFLATISGVAPMLGFLGTTIGMIVTFHEMSLSGVEIQALYGGIMQAMVTTVAGLIVGIYAYMAYNFSVDRVNKVVHYLEWVSAEFLESINADK